MYDCIIIGGGVVGTSIARELSRYKLSVALLEKEEELAFGVSKSNSGIIHPGTQHAPQSLKARLCVQGNSLTRGIARELGVDFQQVGELICAFTRPEIFELHRLIRQARALRVPGVRLVDQVWLRKHEPNLNPQVLAALYAPTAGIVSPYRMVYDLAENAVRNGVTVITQARVEDIHASGRRFAVTTPRQTFEARYLVNCAGLHADDIARMLGIADFTIRPLKGEEFILDKKRKDLARHLIFPLPARHTKGILVIKTADGNPMIGPTAQDTPDKDDYATSDEGLASVLAAAQRLVPSISADDIIAYFAGLRPVAGDDFIIRREPAVPGCVTVAGIQSPGLTAAPAIARMVCALLAAQGMVMRRKLFFRARRRKSTHLFSLPLAKADRLIRREPSYGDIVCRCEMVSAKEIEDAIGRGAQTLDGIKFRTRAQAGRCHGSFCTTRLLKMLAAHKKVALTEVSKRGTGTEIVQKDRGSD